MTSVEALRALNAAENDTKRQFERYASSARIIGSQTEQAAIKNERIVTAALIGGFCLLGTIFLLIGGWMILWGILLIGVGILSGVLYNKGANEKIRKIHNDRQALESGIDNNSTY